MREQPVHYASDPVVRFSYPPYPTCPVIRNGLFRQTHLTLFDPIPATFYPHTNNRSISSHTHMKSLKNTLDQWHIIISWTVWHLAGLVALIVGAAQSAGLTTLDIEQPQNLLLYGMAMLLGKKFLKLLHPVNNTQ